MRMIITYRGSCAIKDIHPKRIWNQIIMKYFTEHGSITAVLCAKFQNNWTAEMDIKDERDFARIEFKMTGLTYISPPIEFICFRSPCFATL